VDYPAQLSELVTPNVEVERQMIALNLALSSFGYPHQRSVELL
jgi:hypothetical protein